MQNTNQQLKMFFGCDISQPKIIVRYETDLLCYNRREGASWFFLRKTVQRETGNNDDNVCYNL